jgi:hypothetical protein
VSDFRQVPKGRPNNDDRFDTPTLEGRPAVRRGTLMLLISVTFDLMSLATRIMQILSAENVVTSTPWLPHRKFTYRNDVSSY